ncbi:ABC transporter substrate-binding protein [Acuticoccus mangrovi]|uniref:ABC transporter substrate-binding protein n=1 Tax=Acuticoccus mangrovi TaxID=2796142 RepID=A0A934IR67_9HYPH|nr:ABC transporter substrate-binding protein [Acuticoccus mangrovi]MBJ3776767.1 ABC transporter substrate-binding protein [Acuticoccus mangrovi]
MTKRAWPAIDRRTFTLGLSAGAAAGAFGGIGRAAAATPATISEAIHLGFYIPIYVAKAKGFFAEQGIDMTIRSAGGIAQPVPALLSGSAEFAVTAPAMSVNATVEGAQMINIAKIVGHISVWVVAKPGTTFESVDDFKGKRIATLKYPSNTITTPTYAMKELGGFDPEAEGATFLQLPFGAQIQAVADGRADIACVFEWDASIAETKFGLETVFAIGGAVGPAVFTSSFVTETFRDENPEMCQNYVNAIAQAQALLHQDPEVFTEVSAAEFPQIDAAVIEAAKARFFGDAPVVPTAPTISKAEWDTMMNHELVAGTLRKSLPYEQMVDNSFAEKAAAEYAAK